MPISDILTQYEWVRRQEYEAQNERYKRAALQDPAFSELRERRNAVMDALNETVKNGGNIKAASLRAHEAYDEISAEERTLLLSMGWPGDYLELHYRCPHCKDTGYVGDPVRRICVCLQRALVKEERMSSIIDSVQIFEKFEPTIYPTEAQKNQMLKTKGILETFADTFPASEPHNIVLLGQAGLGKTFFLNCVAARVQKRGYAAKKISAYHMQQKILQGIRGEYDGEAPFLQAPLLLIDDLGTEPMMNNITREYFFSILNERYNAKSHTIVASNLSGDKILERYGERLFSRLFQTDSSVFRFTGDNLRLVRRTNSGGR
jgi:DNA replication protein DnaC